MTVIDMCNQAALLSDRSDEFVKETGETEFADDALTIYNVFLAAINEAYRAVSKKLACPVKVTTITIPSTKLVDLSALDPPAYQVRAVLSSDQTYKIPYRLIDRNTMEMMTDGSMVLVYHYLPDALTEESDEPTFPEAQADPMIYISLAVSRIYESEKKFDNAVRWKNEYYNQLNAVTSFQGGGVRRVARRAFR